MEPRALPPLIDRPARMLSATGHPLDTAQALVVNAYKRICRDGGIEETARAAVCGAVGEFQRTQNELRSLHKTVHRLREITITPDERTQLAEALDSRLAICEGVQLGLDSSPTTGAVENAKALVEGAERIGLAINSRPADLDEAQGARAGLEREIGELGVIKEALTRGSKRTSAKMPRAPGKMAAEGEALKKGHSGSRVVHLQNRLNSLGNDLRPDGQYGPLTDKAVKDFQTSATLEPDGLVGPRTRDALRDAPADVEAEAAHGAPGGSTPPGGPGEGQPPVPGVPTPEGQTIDGTPPDPLAAKPKARKPATSVVLYKGMGVGESPKPAVKEMQGQLGELGYECDPDGRFGPETEAAVKGFQDEYGLRTDGLVAKRTQKAMKQALAKSKASAEMSEAVHRQMCPDCGRGMSRHLKKCPRCGAEVDGKRMLTNVPPAYGSPEMVKEAAETLEERDFSQGKRDELAKKGLAMRDGSFPIENQHDLDNAAQALGRAAPEKRDAVKAHMRKCAKQLGLSLPGSMQEAADSFGEPLPLGAYLIALTEADLEEALAEGAAEFGHDITLEECSALLENKEGTSLAKASTPEPFSTSRTSNWVARAGGLPAYIQHIAHDLMEKRGKSESNAIQMAIGIVKRWAKGLGGVDANTRAAAAKAVAEWVKMRASNAAKKIGKAAGKAAALAHAATDDEQYRRGRQLAEGHLAKD